MKMSRQHFQAIADTLKDNKPAMMSTDSLPDDEKGLAVAAYGAAYRTWSSMVTDFASMAARSNPRFDRARFYTACGMDY